MLTAQCLIALLVVVGDLPADVLSRIWGAGTRSPSTDVPVMPGNQIRHFEPGRLQMETVTGPGFPARDSMPPRLEFSMAEIGGRRNAALVTGAIEAGDALRFKTWLQGLDAPPDVVALHSPGGLVQEAIEIGRIIRTAELSVMIAPGAACFSACPYILAGGAEREVSTTALIGVHQHYFGENVYLPAFLLVSDIQAGQGELMRYLDDMGIDPMMMAKAMMTPPEDIYILLPDELEEFRLATALAD